MTSTKTICVRCNKEMRTYLCDGCSQRFCLKHLDEHRKNLEREFDQIETNHDELRQMINEQKRDSTKHPLINKIDQWERNSIEKIKQTAQQCRDKLHNQTNSFLLEIENKLYHLAQQMKELRQDNEFNDLDLDQVRQQLKQLKQQLLQPENIFIKQHSMSFINFISLRTSGTENHLLEAVHCTKYSFQPKEDC